FYPCFHFPSLSLRRLAPLEKNGPAETHEYYRGRLSRAASTITLTTRSVAVYIGLWSTRLEWIFAPIRRAINCCVFGLIMRSSSATRNQDGFVFHPGAGAFS